MKTYVYVDGLNLYYGALRKTPYKWLDLEKLFSQLLPNNDIASIKYFTAKIKGGRGDPRKCKRQTAYLSALETLPKVKIFYGHFLVKAVTMPLADPPTVGKRFANVIKTEEKGSDVNLATHLLLDSFRQNCDMAVLVSNDSDFLMPMELVVNQMKMPVGLINPHKHASRVLVRHALYVKQIRRGVLAASQFPSSVRGAHGSIQKPSEW